MVVNFKRFVSYCTLFVLYTERYQRMDHFYGLNRLISCDFIKSRMYISEKQTEKKVRQKADMILKVNIIIGKASVANVNRAGDGGKGRIVQF